MWRWGRDRRVGVFLGDHGVWYKRWYRLIGNVKWGRAVEAVSSSGRGVNLEVMSLVHLPRGLYACVEIC